MRKQKEKEPLQNSVIGTRITKSMHKALIRFLEIDSHTNTSDYLRDLLRRDLENKGFLKTECPA
jgi:hypothetical protein